MQKHKCHVKVSEVGKKGVLLKVLFRQCFFNSVVSAMSEVLFFLSRETSAQKNSHIINIIYDCNMQHANM